MQYTYLICKQLISIIRFGILKYTDDLLPHSINTNKLYKVPPTPVSIISPVLFEFDEPPLATKDDEGTKGRFSLESTLLSDVQTVLNSNSKKHMIFYDIYFIYM